MIGCAACFKQDAKDSIEVVKTPTYSLVLPTTTRNGVYPLAVQPKELPSNLVLEKDDIAIYVCDSKEPLIVTISDKLTLGRAIDSVSHHDLVDLTAFSAYEYGISRSHATLVRKNGQLFVQDCGSANGSCLDGQRMKPFELYIVSPGVQLMLAQLPVQLFFSSLSY